MNSQEIKFENSTNNSPFFIITGSCGMNIPHNLYWLSSQTFVSQHPQQRLEQLENPRGGNSLVRKDLGSVINTGPGK